MTKGVGFLEILIMLPEGDRCWRFLPPENIEQLSALGNVHRNNKGRQFTDEELRELLPQMDAVLTGWGSPCIGAKVLTDKHPGIIAHTAGTVAPYVDEVTCKKGIRVVCANEVFAKGVAEGTLAYILAAQRNIAYWDREVRAGRWQPNSIAKTASLGGKRVGLTAYGALPRYLLPLLKPFNVEILLRSGHMSEDDCKALGVRKAELDEIFSTCDVISVHNGLNDKTRKLIDARLLNMIKDDAVFVNTSRGAVIDEAALEKELAKGRFTAILDVFEHEPLQAGSPFREMQNVILIPHMAGPPSDMHPQAGAAVIGDIRRWKNGEPLQYEAQPDLVQHMTH
jgi:phosphoglycerate dehydrogenase-like enzyme